MLQVKKSGSRGRTSHGWLDSRFSFSFADYYDPENMGFRHLRVINEDLVAPNSGFPMHPHKDMEIITYMVSGMIAHQDSHGHSASIRPGEVQRMSAGSGVFHSEANPSEKERAHLLQIWIQPNQKGGKFSYEQKSFAEEFKKKPLVLVVSQDGREGSISIQQDANLYVSQLKKGERLEFSLPRGRHVWLQLVKGELFVSGHALEPGDALYGSEEKPLEIQSAADSEFLLFDLA